MSDPINKRYDESAAEANRALRQAAQQQRSAQQQAAQRQRAAAKQEAAPQSAQPAAPAPQPAQPVQNPGRTLNTAQAHAAQRAEAARSVRQSAPARQPASAAQRFYAAEVEEPEYEDDAPIRKRRDGQSGCLGGVIYFAFVLSVSIILACVGWLAASDVLALNKEPIEATITLDKDIFSEKVVTVENENGSEEQETVRCVDLDYLADQLKAAGIINYKSLFKLYCNFSHADRQIDPGTYELNTNFDYRALVKKMQIGSGAMVTTKVTIPEGYNMKQIFQKLEEENVCSYDDLMEAAANYKYNYSFLDENAIGDPTRLEGFLFPDTYEFYQGMQASSAINKFLVNFHNRLTEETIDLAAERGLSLKDVINIASMIEKEAANDDERTVIASVIYNRMRRDMPLQVDSTIMYVLEEHGDTLTVEDTKIDSPYNTYQHTGLPPTPISNPGAASIAAAVKPANTNYVYYALDAESGTHQFFTSYSEFSAFVARQSYSN